MDQDLLVGVTPDKSAFDEGNGIWALYDSRNTDYPHNQKSIRYFISGSKYESGYGLPGTTDWVRMRIVFTQEKTIFWDEVLGEHTKEKTVSWTNVYLGIAGDSDSTSRFDYIDWIAVRKYIDPEPSISIGSEEYYLQETTIITGEVSAEFLNADGESLGQVYDAYDTQFYRFKKWPKGFGSLTYKNASSWVANNASVSDVKMGILHGYCLKLTPSTFGSDGEIYYPSGKDLGLDLSWAKWLRLYLYADYENDVTVKIRLHQDADNYFEGSITVKAKEWRKYEILLSSLSKIGDPSLSNINWISIISPYPILIDSDHVFLPATRELLRVKFTLKRDSPDDPSPRVKLAKLIWREGA